MRKFYEEPEMDLTVYSSEDILLESIPVIDVDPDSSGGDWDPGIV